jgi:hypothetical protein
MSLISPEQAAEPQADATPHVGCGTIPEHKIRKKPVND